MEGYRARYVVPGKFAPLKHFMVGVFALAFGLETYHHHKYHGHDDAGAAGGVGAGEEEKKPVTAASARERAAPELDTVQREVEELGARVRAMRAEMMGRE